MKKIVIIASSLIALLVVSTVGYQVLQKNVTPPVVEKTSGEKVVKEEPPVDFDLLSFKGGSQSISDFKGKPVVLNFWASTCPPCIYEMPFFEKQYQTYGEEVEFIMVNVLNFQGETKETAKAFMIDNAYSMPAFFDIDSQGSLLFNVNSVPRTYFIDETGQVVSEHLGAIEETDLSQQIETLLSL